MNRDQIIADVSSQMPERRWLHTEGVMSTAIALAKRYGEDPQHAELAAIIHDVAKYWTVESQANYIREHRLDESILAYGKELWHAEVGASVAKNQYGVLDYHIINAIRYHTSGRYGMSKLEKIIWLADYIEPGRSFPGVDVARALAEISLEKAILYGLDQTIQFLIEKEKRIYPVTVEARNGIIDELR